MRNYIMVSLTLETIGWNYNNITTLATKRHLISHCDSKLQPDFWKSTVCKAHIMGHILADYWEALEHKQNWPYSKHTCNQWRCVSWMGRGTTGSQTHHSSRHKCNFLTNATAQEDMSSICLLTEKGLGVCPAVSVCWGETRWEVERQRMGRGLEFE